MIFKLAGFLFPFLKSFFGEGVIETVLNHKRQVAASANEADRVRIDADVRALEFELDRRKAQRDLQLKEAEHPYLWWPKFLIMMAVAVYVFARFNVKIWGLDDYGIAVADLSDWEAGVASVVLGYLFLGDKLQRTKSK